MHEYFSVVTVAAAAYLNVHYIVLYFVVAVFVVQCTKHHFNVNVYKTFYSRETALETEPIEIQANDCFSLVQTAQCACYFELHGYKRKM